jgi:predicted lipase
MFHSKSTDASKSVSAHKGFSSLYESLGGKINEELKKLLNVLRDKVPPSETFHLLFTGHSMGGALAHLAAMRWKKYEKTIDPYTTPAVHVYSFGAPRVFSRWGFRKYNKKVPTSFR